MLFRSCALAASAIFLLSACVSAPAPKPAPPPKKPAVSLPPPKPVATPRPAPKIENAANTPGFSRPAPELVDEIQALWKAFPGKTGIAVRRIDGDWVLAQRGDEFFPQQSVSKLWVAMAWFDAVDRGAQQPGATIRIGPDDLTLFHQPIADRVKREGSIEESASVLVETAIITSDNTANDSVMRTLGGPDAVRNFLAKKNLSGIRFGPGERLLQSGIAGLNWTQAMSVGRSFQAERSKLPDWIRKKALESYVADPIDGATPTAIVNALSRLARGELLSQRSTRQVLSMLERVQSGPQRLKAGAPEGWTVGHKTGTGQVFEMTATGYNDVGIITAPDGTRYAVAVMLASTTASVPERMTLMQSVARAIATWHNK
jgi:beta-lactamase class A